MIMENSANSKVVQRYVDILPNPGFKAVFGDVANKDAVMMIINEFLPAHRKVLHIEYLPTNHQGPVLSLNKEHQFDFMCRDSSGTVFIVEMQCYTEKSWFQRCVSYASRAYDRQSRKGKHYDVSPVILIGLMGKSQQYQGLGENQVKHWYRGGTLLQLCARGVCRKPYHCS